MAQTEDVTRDQLVAERVRAALRDKGWSAAAFARELGRPYQGVKRRLWGEVPWTAGDLLEVAEVLELPVAELLGEEE